MIDRQAFLEVVRDALRSPEVQAVIHLTVREAVKGELTRILEDEVLDVEAAAQLLHIKPEALYKRYARGQVPGTKIGKRLTFRRSHLLQLGDVSK
jgi:hypothetical protein